MERRGEALRPLVVRHARKNLPWTKAAAHIFLFPYMASSQSWFVAVRCFAIKRCHRFWNAAVGEEHAASHIRALNSVCAAGEPRRCSSMPCSTCNEQKRWLDTGNTIRDSW